jgi:nucleoid-associated protein YgaU
MMDYWASFEEDATTEAEAAEESGNALPHADDPQLETQQSENPDEAAKDDSGNDVKDDADAPVSQIPQTQNAENAVSVPPASAVSVLPTAQNTVSATAQSAVSVPSAIVTANGQQSPEEQSKQEQLLADRLNNSEAERKKANDELALAKKAQADAEAARKKTEADAAAAQKKAAADAAAAKKKADTELAAAKKAQSDAEAARKKAEADAAAAKKKADAELAAAKKAHSDAEAARKKAEADAVFAQQARLDAEAARVKAEEDAATARASSVASSAPPARMQVQQVTVSRQIETPAPARAPVPATSSVLPQYFEVRNRPYDSFWGIATSPAVYQNGEQWRTLYNANRDKLTDPDNPDLIELGVILEIPSISGETRQGTFDPNISYLRR